MPVPPSHLSQIEDLLRGVAVVARGRSGRLAALTLAVASELPQDEVRVAIRQRLERLGLPGVDVQLCPMAGAPRLLSVEYAR